MFTFDHNIIFSTEDFIILISYLFKILQKDSYDTKFDGDCHFF